MTCDGIISKITWQTISKSLRVSRTAVLNARAKGEFPASWYLGMKSLCQEEGVVCPPELFGFKSVVPADTAA